MLRAPPTDEAVQINLRLPRELISLVDELVAKRRRERPGASVSRSDVIRETLYLAARAELPSAEGSRP